MSQLFYYDKAGNKKPTTVPELKTMALSGVIDKTTVIETDDGRRACAEKVKGLVFPEQPAPFPSPLSETKSSERPQASPAPQSPVPTLGDGGASSQKNDLPQGAGVEAGPFASSEPSCRQCGAKLQAGQAFCSRCGAPQNAVVPPRRAFCSRCGAKLQADQAFCSSCGAPQNGTGAPAFVTNAEVNQSGGKKYSKTTAGILALLIGGFGIHKFYLGSWGWGILYILFCWTSIPAIFGLVEGIVYLTSDENAFDAKYNLTPNSPFRW